MKATGANAHKINKLIGNYRNGLEFAKYYQKSKNKEKMAFSVDMAERSELALRKLLN